MPVIYSSHITLAGLALIKMRFCSHSKLYTPISRNTYRHDFRCAFLTLGFFETYIIFYYSEVTHKPLITAAIFFMPQYNAHLLKYLRICLAYTDTLPPSYNIFLLLHFTGSCTSAAKQKTHSRLMARH